jgi:GAF domain-containing protein
MALPTRSAEGTLTPPYGDIRQQFASLVAGERDGLANAANLAALLFEHLPDVNWAGFYFLRGTELVLGPFQGKVACVRIPLGRGVCGTAASTGQVIVVPDVHEFPGHIACDAASESEIVVPVLDDGRLLGVLDLDSPRRARFGPEDAAALQSLVDVLRMSSDFGALVPGSRV